MKLATRRAIGGVKQKLSVSCVVPAPQLLVGKVPNTSIQATDFILEFPTESDGKNLLMKTPYTLVTRHLNMLVPARKLPDLWLVFAVLVSATQAAEEVLCD